jgi:hypothetical protein
MNDDTIWHEYPTELLDEADAWREAAHQEWLNRTPCDPDPYNVSYFTLIKRWLARQHQNILMIND